jgi:V/A-type H+/Na+-transporting ATPase subunit E
MTRTLGDITNELKEKVLAPAKEEAERMVREARSQADKILLEARKEGAHITDQARQQADVTLKQMEANMNTAARDFILLVQERLEKTVVRPVVEDEVMAVLDSKEFITSIIDTVITEFARTHGKENRIEILLPERQKAKLEKWFVGKFLHRTSGGLVVHFTDKVAFGFKLGLDDTGTYFNFGEGLVEVFCQFCSPRFRKYFISPREAS